MINDLHTFPLCVTHETSPLYNMRGWWANGSFEVPTSRHCGPNPNTSTQSCSVQVASKLTGHRVSVDGISVKFFRIKCAKDSLVERTNNRNYHNLMCSQAEWQSSCQYIPAQWLTKRRITILIPRYVTTKQLNYTASLSMCLATSVRSEASQIKPTA